DTNIISRLVDGQYPPYQDIVPASFNTTITTEKSALVSALKAGSIFSQNNNSVKFEYNAQKEKLVLSTESSELGKSVVELPSHIEGASGSLILNHHYLLDCLSSIESPNVIMKIVDNNTASILYPEGKNDYMYLVMPIKS